MFLWPVHLAAEAQSRPFSLFAWMSCLAAETPLKRPRSPGGGRKSEQTDEISFHLKIFSILFLLAVLLFILLFFIILW